MTLDKKLEYCLAHTRCSKISFLFLIFFPLGFNQKSKDTKMAFPFVWGEDDYSADELSAFHTHFNSHGMSPPRLLVTH